MIAVTAAREESNGREDVRGVRKIWRRRVRGREVKKGRIFGISAYWIDGEEADIGIDEETDGDILKHSFEIASKLDDSE